MYIRHAYNVFIPYAQRFAHDSVAFSQLVLISTQTFLPRTTQLLYDYSELRELKLSEKQTATNLEWGAQFGCYLERGILTGSTVR